MLKFLFLILFSFNFAVANHIPDGWHEEWPKVDFTKTNIDLHEIISGGPAKDSIASIDNPKFVTIDKVTDIEEHEPLITVKMGNEIRAYPIRIMIYHEIVNDEMAGIPIVVTYCPLCNSAIIFKRKIKDQILEFGTTGKLRHSDMVMYDRTTESWWQQFTGEVIVGEYLGSKLVKIPARVESFKKFRKRKGELKVLTVENTALRNYGFNPYVKYDSSLSPFLYKGDYKGEIPALARVVMVGNKAWSLELVRNKQIIEEGDLMISWHRGQNSALDTIKISNGRDIGNIIVQRKDKSGKWQDEIYQVPFAFAYKAFYPDGKIIVK